MVVSATGSINTPVEGLRDLLANLSAFQVWLGVDEDDAVAAKALVYLYEQEITINATTGAPAASVPRWALVHWPEDLGSLSATGYRGELYLQFHEEVHEDNEGDFADEYHAFMNSISTIMDAALALAQTAGYLYFLEVRPVAPIRNVRGEESTQEPHWDLAFTVPVGLQPAST